MLDPAEAAREWAISPPSAVRTSAGRLGVALAVSWRAAVLALAFAVCLISSAASAHSLAQIQQQLYNSEEFFQVVNRAATNFNLRDSEGRLVRLDDFKGKVVVLGFLDGHCTDLCPLLSDLLAKIQQTINRTPLRGQVQFVSISINPKQDTLDFMKKYGAAHGFDPRNWVFLTTLPDQPDNATRRLALGHGQKFTQPKDGDFLHGLVTDLIDPSGMLRGKFYGLKFEPANFIAFVNALANDGGKSKNKGEQGPLMLVSDVPAPMAAPEDHSGLALPAAALALSLMWLVAAITFFVLRRRRRAAASRDGGTWRDRSTAAGELTEAGR